MVASPPVSDTPSSPRDPASGPVAPVPGRGHGMRDYALQRLRESWILRAAAIAAFMGYGGLIALVLGGKLDFSEAGMVAVLSLGSWFFLFWWYPVMQRTQEQLDQDPRRMAIGPLLEAIAIGCDVVVHVFMALIVVLSARS